MEVFKIKNIVKIDKIKIKNNTFKKYLALTETFGLFRFLELIRWILIDIIRSFSKNKQIHLYGIFCIEGMYGQGKTTVLSKIGWDLRKKYGDKVLICTNYGFKLQDFQFSSIAQVGQQYDKPIVFLWDEVQNDFPSTERNFPIEVRKALTLNRKGNGKQFFWCSQDAELVHKTIRRLTVKTGLVRTLFRRYTRVKWYLQEDYLQLKNTVTVDRKMKIHPIAKMKFIQSDELRDMFNSFEVDNGEKLT